MARLRYLGISFFEIVTDEGKVVYVDPCISINPDCPITLDDIGRADLVVVSHKARDHAREAIPLVKKTGAPMVCTRDLGYSARRAGIPADRIRTVPSGVVVERAGIRIRSLKTEHGSWSEDEGFPMYAPSLGYMIYLREGVAIYHVGDTSIFGDFQLFGRLYRPKVMLTPIGAFHLALTEMDPREAAIATGMVSPEIVVPMHWDRKDQADYPRQFARHMETEAPHVQVRILEPGDTLEV